MSHRTRIPERICRRLRGFLPLALAAGLISGSALYSPAAQAADGKELFEMSCATCHLGGGGDGCQLVADFALLCGVNPAEGPGLSVPIVPGGLSAAIMVFHALATRLPGRDIGP